MVGKLVVAPSYPGLPPLNKEYGDPWGPIAPNVPDTLVSGASSNEAVERAPVFKAPSPNPSMVKTPSGQLISTRRSVNHTILGR